MVWATPRSDKNTVTEAGRILIAKKPGYVEYLDALDTVSNFRSSHSYPLHAFYVTLNRKAHAIDSHRLVARRLKRLPSIEAKLKRFRSLTLAEMQDIGGCRAILQNIDQVQKLYDLYKSKSRLRHRLIDEDHYIWNPKKSGYRGIHLIYECEFEEKNVVYNGLRIEIQLRSKLQHAWATAVETFGTFTRQSLKSSQGDLRWLRFFALMGSAMALRESSPLVPGTPTDKAELIKELKHYAQELHVENLLEAYGAAAQIIRSSISKNAAYYLLELNSQEKIVNVTGYKESELTVATARYLEVEQAIKDNPNAEAVLVAVGSVESLEKAYPNYFLDTKMFIQALKRELE